MQFGLLEGTPSEQTFHYVPMGFNSGWHFVFCFTFIFQILAAKIQHLPLSLRDMYAVMCAPVTVDDPRMMRAYLYYVEQLASKKQCPIRLSFDKNRHPTDKVLYDYECVHKTLNLYMWLSIRYPQIYTQYKEASATAAELETIIFDSLLYMSEESLKKNSQIDALRSVLSRMPSSWVVSDGDDVGVHERPNSQNRRAEKEHPGESDDKLSMESEPDKSGK